MSFHIDTIFAITPATSTTVSTVMSTQLAHPTGALPNLERWVPVTMLNLCVKILLSGLIMLIALGISLYLRRRVVRSLKKSILDRWVIETLGTFIILASLVMGGIITLSVWRDLGSFFDELRTMHGIDIYQIGGQLLETILLISLGIGIARTLQSLTHRVLNQKHIDINLRTFVSRTFYCIALIIVGFWMLSIWNIPLGIPATAVGILSVIVSFAVQDILKDLVAGFYLLIERPFFIGDQISVTIAPTVIYVGQVQDVKLRATRLRLIGGEEISIPNAILFGGPVTNNTYFRERRAAITVTLPGTDFSRDETVERIRKALNEISIIMPKPEPAVICSKYVADKVTLLVRFWTASDQTIDVSEVMHALHTLMPTAELTAVEPIGAA